MDCPSAKKTSRLEKKLNLSTFFLSQLICLDLFFYILNVFFQSRAQRCSVCKEVIVGAFFNIGDKILCEEHYKANAETCPR